MTTTDKGWSWAILAGSFGCSFLIFGTLSGGGIFYKAFLNLYGSNHLETIWVLFFMQICLNFMGPLAAYLGQRFTYRKVVMTGGLMAAFGIGLSYFATSVYHLYATFGLIYGIGVGLVVNPHIIMVNFAFDKYRAVANGIFSSGASIGSIIIPPTLEALHETYGLRGLFLIWSGIILNICVCGAVYRQITKRASPVDQKKEQYATELKSTNDTTNGLLLTNNAPPSPPPTSRWRTFSFFANYSFWTIAFGWSFVTFGISCFAVILPDFATSQNDSISLSEASFLVSSWAIGDLIGRIGCGWIIDRKWIQLKHFYIGTMTMAACAAIWTQFFYSYAALAACSFAFGVSLGASFIQHPLLLIKCLGIETFQRAFGFLGVLAGINLVGLTSLVGYLRDTTQSYHANFTLIGVLLLLPAAVWLCDVVYKVLKKKRTRVVIRDHHAEAALST